MPWVAIAAAEVGSTLYSAYEKKQQANADATLAENQAEQALARSSIQQAQRKRQTRAVEGKQIAAYAGSGVTMQGSPMDALAYQAIMGNYALQIDKYNGMVSAKNRISMANYYQNAGSAYLTSGILSAAGEAFGAYTNYKMTQPGVG